MKLPIYTKLRRLGFSQDEARTAASIADRTLRHRRDVMIAVCAASGASVAELAAGWSLSVAHVRRIVARTALPTRVRQDAEDARRRLEKTRPADSQLRRCVGIARSPVDR